MYVHVHWQVHVYVLIKLFFAGMATREDSCLLPIPTLGSVNEATGGARYMYIIIHLHVHTYMYIYTCTCIYVYGHTYLHVHFHVVVDGSILMNLGL